MRILITAGPTREYIDDVRYISNGSSGKMGYAVAEAAVKHNHKVFLVSGPVSLPTPKSVHRIDITTSSDMLRECLRVYPECDGVIAVAAVCDYRPEKIASGKLKKDGSTRNLPLTETEDILANLGQRKRHQWILGFALEAENAAQEAIRKRHAKGCDAIVLNHTSAISADVTSIQIIDHTDRVVHTCKGLKPDVADNLLTWIESALVVSSKTPDGTSVRQPDE